MSDLLSTYIVAGSVMGLCFLAIGVGILWFGREDIGGDCRKAPENRTEGCLSKEVGVCPMDDKDGYLRMATSGSRAMKPSRHKH